MVIFIAIRTPEECNEEGTRHLTPVKSKVRTLTTFIQGERLNNSQNDTFKYCDVSK